MHDVLGHRISLLSLQAGALALRADPLTEEVARAAGLIRDTAHQAMEELREVIGVLRIDPVGDDGAPARPQSTLVDLAELVDECRRAGMLRWVGSAIVNGRSPPRSPGAGPTRRSVPSCS
jgi:hypothetical protein